MSSTVERLQLYEAILDIIDQHRAQTGDEALGESIERAVIDSQVREIEREIFANPGAVEPWLIRQRRGEA